MDVNMNHISMEAASEQKNDSGASNQRLTKNQKRRLKKKQKKQQAKQDAQNGIQEQQPDHKSDEKKAKEAAKPVEIEYITRELDLEGTDYAEFQNIFNKFHLYEEKATGKSSVKTVADEERKDVDDMEVAEVDDEEDQTEQETGLSRRQRKKINRLSVAELKQLVSHPEVVEAHDVTAADPRLLVNLKATRNTVPVPRHWCHKRKYLQGKRGIERPPFQLPDFIANTGIGQLRSAWDEVDSQKSLKQQARDRINPRLGKIDIDYKILHDAFFKYQTKPRMTRHGDLYYEGKEFEVKMLHKRPGVLSEELKKALGMPEGAPPPWLINMQRYGPPPAYPNLKIPGLNAPIPEGASYGFHPGGWGKPPVNEFGQPLYGDVFGTAPKPEVTEVDMSGIQREQWGAITEDLASESEEEEEEEEEAPEAEAAAAAATAPAGVATPLTEGVASLAAGLETPESIALRKGHGTETPGTPAPAQPYKVIREEETSAREGFMGASKRYVVDDEQSATVSLDPSELTRLDKAALERKLQEQIAAGSAEKADASVSESEKKRRRKDASSDKASKRKKESKFF